VPDLADSIAALFIRAVEGDFGGTPRDARIARALRKIDVRLRRERGVAALARDLCEQKIVEQVVGQLLIGKRRAVYGLGCERLRFAGGRVRVGFVLRFLSRGACCGGVAAHPANTTNAMPAKQPQSAARMCNWLFGPSMEYLLS